VGHQEPYETKETVPAHEILFEGTNLIPLETSYEVGQANHPSSAVDDAPYMKWHAAVSTHSAAVLDNDSGKNTLHKAICYHKFEDPGHVADCTNHVESHLLLPVLTLWPTRCIGASHTDSAEMGNCTCKVIVLYVQSTLSMLILVELPQLLLLQPASENLVALDRDRHDESSQCGGTACCATDSV